MSDPRTREEINAEIARRLFSRNDYDRLITSRADFRPASSFDTALRLVVPAMRERGYLFSIDDFCGDGNTSAVMFIAKESSAKGEVICKYGEEPSAICEAALVAMDAEEARG